MKAIVYKQYGLPDVLRMEDVEKPEPGDDEVLVRIHAVSVNCADWRLLTGTPFVARIAFGPFRPNKAILGTDVAGTVVSTGSSVTDFKPGDRVFGDLGTQRLGGFAEYVCALQSVLAPMPSNLTFSEAAALPMASITALQALRDGGKVKPGQKVLIHGAAGGVGTYAVQIAKYMGADVTAVCGTRNVDMVRSLGADRVIDYTKEDFAAEGLLYNLILGINGNRTINDYSKALAPDGTYLMVGGSNRQLFQSMLLGRFFSRKSGKTMGIFPAKNSRDDLLEIKKLVEEGKIRPVIDRQFALEQTPEAMRIIGSGHARAKLVINVIPETK
jgi:NADPH:quinone reductase-like Zn-dependent oxidoreductase